MIVHRDMTFCSGPCATKECPRHRDHAKGATLPVSMADLRPGCKQYREVSNGKG